MSVDDHRQKNGERFFLCDEGLDKRKQERDNFLRSEARRHTSKIMARDQILGKLTVENLQKKESRRLRLEDTTNNQERERKKK